MNARGVLSTLARHGAYGLRAALQGPPAPQEPTHGPLPPEAITELCGRCGNPVEVVGRDGCGGDLIRCGCCAPASAPPMRGEPAAECVPGSRASAGQWAEAFSAAGVAINYEGFEEQAHYLLLAAGELDAIAHGDMAR